MFVKISNTKVVFLIIAVLFFVGAFFVYKEAHAYGEIKGTSLGEFSSGCDYYLIEDSYGDYSLVEWYGGITPDSGDVVVGELHSYGFKDLYNISRDNSTHVWIDDWMLSEDRAAEKLIDKCGYDRNISTYFDTGYGAYIPTYTPPILSAPTCPANSSAINGQCVCNSGYKASGSVCITYTQSCQNQYGINSYGDSQYCYCSTGYQWNAAKTSCIQIPTCSEGYTLNASNQCITYAQSCQAVNNNDPNIIGLKGENGKINCSCIANYYWNGSQCIKNVTTEIQKPPVVEPKKTEPIISDVLKKIPSKTSVESPKIKSTTSSVVSSSTSSEKEATSTSAIDSKNSSAPRIPWYKKILNFFSGLFK